MSAIEPLKQFDVQAQVVNGKRCVLVALKSSASTSRLRLTIAQARRLSIDLSMASLPGATDAEVARQVAEMEARWTARD